MFYVGIDIAKKNHEASIINSKGELLDKSISFSNLKQVVLNYFLCLINLKLIPPILLLVWKQLDITGLAFILI